jgi:hypothetical protein
MVGALVIQGESNVYLVIAPAGGLVGVHLDQEGAARTQAAGVNGVVACVPVIADFRPLPVSTTTDAERHGDPMAGLAEQVAAGAYARRGNYGPGQPRPRQ